MDDPGGSSEANHAATCEGLTSLDLGLHRGKESAGVQFMGKNGVVRQASPLPLITLANCPALALNVCFECALPLRHRRAPPWMHA